MAPSKNYAAHVAARRDQADAALEATGHDAMVLHSGVPFTYFADDMEAPHHPNPHFASWVPLEGPHHLLLVKKGAKPKLVRYAPEDFWYEQAPVGEPYWLEPFDYAEVTSKEQAWDAVEMDGKVAYLGDSPDEAARNALDPNPEELENRLDWNRSYKTPYEADCVEEANRRAAKGHAAARAAFEEGASELAIHHAYVQAVGVVDHQLPYNSIVALDKNGATLHYDKKRTTPNGKVLLIDAGAVEAGYASDITRTWVAPDCDEVFKELVAGVDALQVELCGSVKPGMTYPQLHHDAHVAIGDLLERLGILKVGGEEAVETGLTRPFFPHGLGHYLGVQVHDVAGHQAAPEGGTNAPDEKHPYLRTTRPIEPGMLFTVEPGVYFIPMLLRDHRASTAKDGTAKLFDWDLIDRLTPLGGVRIEDNVWVTEDGARNLTRPYV